MELNINFKRELEPLINSSESLADWFEKNQEMMAYFEMTHPGCLHFENTNANYDVKMLGRMASGCLTWLETKLPYSNEEKVKNASMAIALIYDMAKEHLSDVARDKYFIDVEGSKKLDAGPIQGGMHR